MSVVSISSPRKTDGEVRMSDQKNYISCSNWEPYHTVWTTMVSNVAAVKFSFDVSKCVQGELLAFMRDGEGRRFIGLLTRDKTVCNLAI